MAASRKTVSQLTAADKFYIQKNYDLLSIKQLAADTGATPNAVQRFLETLPLPPEPTEPKAPEPPKPDIKPEDSITGTAVSAQTPIVRDDGVTITTPASAQWSDEATKRMNGQNYIENNRDRIFRPRPGKPSR